MITRQSKLPSLFSHLIKYSENFKKCCFYYHGHHMLDETPKITSVHVHRLMLCLIHQNRQSEALNVFKRHLRMGLYQIDEVVVGLACKACVGQLNLGYKIHGFSVTSGFMSYIAVCNSLMNMYCKSGDTKRASSIFARLDNPDTVSYNTMLSGYEDSRSALVFARHMHFRGVDFDAVTYTMVLAHSVDAVEFDFGFQVHCLSVKFGLETEVFVGNALVTLYSRYGTMSDAEKVFNEMPRKDLVSWNAILSGYAQEGNHGNEAILGFLQMGKQGMDLDHVSFTSVVSACGQERDLEFGRQVHGLSMKRGYSSHVSVCNVLMSLYSKCEIHEEAKLVFKKISNRNVVSWTTMISINEEEAVILFKEMITCNVCPNDVTFICLIHAITEHNTMQEGQMVHGLCIKSNFTSETSVVNSLITMYGKFKSVEGFVKIFEELDHHREIISWNALISGYTLNEMYQDAIQAFLFVAAELQPNPYTFGSVLHAIASSESISLKQGQQCHAYITKLGLDTDPVVSGALLDMYAKRGSIHESQKIFHGLKRKTQVSWTSIISAHSSHGDYESVMKYFNEMLMEGVKPDSITFLSVLTACGRNGMVDAGIKVFDSMVNAHYVEPCSEHYSCIVDMLGRAGRLDEAEDFLNKVPGGPGVSVLQSLLGACKIYGNIDMALRISNVLITMEPTDSGSYVLMSNLYAEKGKWEKVAKIRTMMRDRKVNKEVGFSWADVGKGGDSMNLHGFSSSDKSHPLSAEIYMMAEMVGSEMRRERERPVMIFDDHNRLDFLEAT